MKLKFLFPAAMSVLVLSCEKYDFEYVKEDPATFTEISSLNIGKVGAAEITAFDPATKRLFVVTNVAEATQIDIVDLKNPAAPTLIGAIDITPYGGGVNSVSVKDGKLAAAIQAVVKTDPGTVAVFKTSDYTLIKKVQVGALPDMITFSPDGKYILTANEGEPNDAYTVDPIGTVSVVAVNENYAVTNIDFSSWASKQTALQAKGFRVFGPNASFAQDIEPEYVTISDDSKTAWVTLQENNGIAKIDIRSKTITQIFPLGFKDYNKASNAIDPSDRDGGIFLKQWNIKGMYQPDAIAVGIDKGVPYLFTANEGDVREWAGFAENKRVKDLSLNITAFPDAATVKTDPFLGRLNVTSTLGKNASNEYDALYSFGARSFSVWNGHNGELIYDSKNQLEQKAIEAGLYDDTRSDDKGVEPEGITLGVVGNTALAFVGMERADALAIYDVSNPYSPKFIKILKTGDAPEGITFVPASNSPTKKSLVIVSSENDGKIVVYSTTK